MRRFLIPIIALLAAAPAAAQGASTYRSDSGFSVDLPAGWTRAPERAVAEVSRAAGTLPPGLAYEVVFQAGGAPWPAEPFAAIAQGIAPSWLTPEEFRRRWTARNAQAQLQGRANRADTLRTGRLGLRVGEPWWDEGNRAAWMRVAMESTGGFAWTVMMLHPSGGTIIMLQYQGAPGADEARVLEQLDLVVRSLRVD